MIYALYAIGLLAAFIVLIVIIAAFRPSDFRVTRSQLIKATPERLFPYINSLKKFQDWNPYKEKDPNAKNDFSGPESGPGARFHWSGNANAGEGSLTILSSEPPRQVSLELKIMKPFSCQNLVDFSLAPQADGTVVTWSMTGRNALFPKVMGLFINMDKMIGTDFETGLKMLKTKLEVD